MVYQSFRAIRIASQMFGIRYIEPVYEFTSAALSTSRYKKVLSVFTKQ